MPKKLETKNQSPEMEHKIFTFSVSDLDTEGRTIEGYASTFGNLDHTNDIIHPGAFAKSIVERGSKIKLLWNHDVGEVIGKVQHLSEDQHGLFMRSIISNTEKGRDVLALLEDGAISELSIGFTPVPGGTKYEKNNEGKTIRHLKEIKLYEISLTPFPANEHAVITALKEQTLPETEDEGIEIVDEEVKAPTKKVGGQNLPSSAFLVVEDAQEPSTWHLPVKKMSGGKLVADRRRMGAAKAALTVGYRGNKYSGPGKSSAISKLKAMYKREGMDWDGDKQLYLEMFDTELVVEEEEVKEMGENGPIQRLGDVLIGTLHQTFTNLADSWYVQGFIGKEQRIQMSNLIGDALDVLGEGIPSDILSIELQVYPMMGLFSFAKIEETKDDGSELEELPPEKSTEIKLLEIERIKNLAVEV